MSGFWGKILKLKLVRYHPMTQNDPELGLNDSLRYVQYDRTNLKNDLCKTNFSQKFDLADFLSKNFPIFRFGVNLFNLKLMRYHPMIQINPEMGLNDSLRRGKYDSTNFFK